MRRTDRQITDRAEIDAIIQRCRVCRIGMVDLEGQPYVVPLCFGYDGQSVFLHMASDGRKVTCLRTNNRVCLEFDIPGDVTDAPEPCHWGMSYASVIAFGVAEFLESAEQKRHGLSLIMRQYSGAEMEWTFPTGSLDRTIVVRVRIAEVTGKARLSKERPGRKDPSTQWRSLQ